jgi:diaminohydroxyphosphoribosylaminopyrimidine deaminase/5-amino-6-(5-phosphoribosylamino)uracil reductase
MTERDRRWLARAVELSRRCPPSPTAFSVGAVIVVDGLVVSEGHSRQHDDREHAEEAALDRAGGAPAHRPSGGVDLSAATMYTSLEPCGVRRSRPRPCAELIIAAGIPRVVYALGEPPLLAPGGGAAKLRAAGVEVVQLPELADEVREINAHLLGSVS